MGRQDKLTADEEWDDARITAAAEADPDNPPLTDEEIAAMRPIWAFPELVDSLGLNKERREDRVEVMLRLDAEVLERLRRAGDGWEDYANAVLRRGLEG